MTFFFFQPIEMAMFAIGIASTQINAFIQPAWGFFTLHPRFLSLLRGMEHPIASSATQGSAAMQHQSTGNNGCCVVHWGGVRKWDRHRQKGPHGYGVRLVHTEREWEKGKEWETGEMEREREQQQASEPASQGTGIRPFHLSIVWLWVRRRGWRLCYTLLSGHTVQL